MKILFSFLSLFLAAQPVLADDGSPVPNPPGAHPTSPVPAYVLSNAPNGYELGAYVDCGPSRMAVGESGSLRQLQGESWTWPDARVHDSLGSCAFDATEVIYEVAGLRPDDDYVLGFTWWDFDRQNRVQSVRFGVGEPIQWTTVLPAAPAAAWYADLPTWAEIFLPIPEQYRKAGRLQVSFHREGPSNAVVNEIWLLRRPKPAAPKTLRRIAIVTGDEYPGHLWRQTAPELAAILRADPRLEVAIIESPMVMASPLVSHYDAVVLNYMNWTGHPDPGEPVGKALQQYVESGKGLVLVHFACGAFQSWKGFVNLTGRVYDPKLRPHDPYGPFDVRLTDREHPITAGMNAFKAIDELYTCLAGDVPIKVLAEATSAVDHKAYPMAFVLDVGKGRVFHSPLGHDVNSLRAPGTRDLFRRGTAWAAGLEPR
jgi:type 1 glutamine amidotransferase